jgi:hypothetical protein
VVESQSPAGQLLVGVDFLPKDSRTLRTLAATHPDSFYAVVLLGKVLGTVTGSQFMDSGTSNPFQIAGGANVHNQLVKKIAEVLHAPLRVTASPCDRCGTPTTQDS